MLSRVIINVIRKTKCCNARTFCYIPNSLRSNVLKHDSDTKECVIQNHYNLYIGKRFKSKGKGVDNKKNRDEESDEETEEDYEAPAGSKILTVNVISLRLDAIAKVGFGISRTKIEEAFYNSQFRINGKKVLKKSKEVDVGDEIDMILHRNLDNPEFLNINRILILSIDPKSNSIRVKLSSDKNLLIEDYEEAWSST